jgi:hypothetical protein
MRKISLGLAVGFLFLVGSVFAAQQTIYTGAGTTTEQDKIKINENFTEVYSNAANAVFCVDVLDETTSLSVEALETFHMPYAMAITAIRAGVTTAPTGAAILLNITEAGTTIFTTQVMIDATETTSVTATTPYVLSDTTLADNAIIAIAPTQVGSTEPGDGLEVCFYGTRTF